MSFQYLGDRLIISDLDRTELGFSGLRVSQILLRNCHDCIFDLHKLEVINQNKALKFTPVIAEEDTCSNNEILNFKSMSKHHLMELPRVGIEAKGNDTYIHHNSVEQYLIGYLMRGDGGRCEDNETIRSLNDDVRIMNAHRVRVKDNDLIETSAYRVGILHNDGIQIVGNDINVPLEDIIISGNNISCHNIDNYKQGIIASEGATKGIQIFENVFDINHELVVLLNFSINGEVYDNRGTAKNGGFIRFGSSKQERIGMKQTNNKWDRNDFPCNVFDM